MGLLAVSEGTQLCRLLVSKGGRGSSLWRGDRVRLKRPRRADSVSVCVCDMVGDTKASMWTTAWAAAGKLAE